MRNWKLDYVKVVLAIMIIFIHIPLPGNIGKIMDSLARIGVPFFFMVSGYFCNKRKIERKIIRTFKLLILLITIYFLYLMFSLGNIENLVEWTKKLMHVKYFIYTFAFNMIYVGGHLWFIDSLLYVYIIYYFVVKFDMEKWAYIISPFLILIQLILGAL